MSVHPIEYRYFYPEMKRIWTEESKLETWLKVEAVLAKVHGKLGNISQSAAQEIERKASLDFVKLERVKEIEEETEHDLMAMVEALTEVCEADAKNYVHLGATSYDIEDTALSLQLRDAIRIIESDIDGLKNVLLDLAEKHKETICVARTHGQHALPTTYGMKFAVWATEMQRHLERLDEAKKRMLVGKMAGAVGTGASHGEKAEDIHNLVIQELGLEPTLISTQVVQRDRHAELVVKLALVAATLDKIAKEIRNLQRTEIAEIAEPFKQKQVGSSAMPGKRNPHKSERICGLARIVKSNVFPALENMSLEHERDLTNSSAERIIFPETFILVDYMLREMLKILVGLEFFPENIIRNLKLSNGIILAELVMTKLVERGMGRQDAHELLRDLSRKTVQERVDLRDVLKSDERIRKYLTVDDIENLKEEHYIGRAVEIVENVIKELR